MSAEELLVKVIQAWFALYMNEVGVAETGSEEWFYFSRSPLVQEAEMLLGKCLRPDWADIPEMGE